MEWDVGPGTLPAGLVTSLCYADCPTAPLVPPHRTAPLAAQQESALETCPTAQRQQHNSVSSL